MNHETRPKTLRAARGLLALALVHGGPLVPTLADQSQQSPVVPSESGERLGPGPPFTKESLLEALRSNDDESKSARQIRWRGSSFRPSAAEEEELREAGATPCILGLIRLHYRPAQGGDDPQPEGGGPDPCGEKKRDYKRVFKPSEVSKKAVITSKPGPGYTEKARLNGVQGLVRLRVIFAADGQVKHITLIKGLPDGLTEKAVEAAKKIRFTPAEEGGRKVSQSAVIEYRFDL